jgi:demethylmenaquinone methyltransferase/2-methoxy-6-polyprenyl-1,4-benzoquinol methylase
MPRLIWQMLCRQNSEKFNTLTLRRGKLIILSYKVQNLNNINMKSGSKQSSTNSVGLLFGRIAPVYDKLNHILSFGMDYFWRARLANLIEKENQSRILDLATGTGDLLITLLRKNPNITEAVGLDISQKMLDICYKKIMDYNLTEGVNLFCADAASSGLSDNAFDVVTIGFGIRNTSDTLKTLGEIFRLLKQGGEVLILEFSLPSNRILKFFYLLYLRYYVPFIGRLLSGDKVAYRYLNTSIEKFYNEEDLFSLMLKTGFENISVIPVTFGIANIYKGSKPISKIS